MIPLENLRMRLHYCVAIFLVAALAGAVSAQIFPGLPPSAPPAPAQTQPATAPTTAPAPPAPPQGPVQSTLDQALAQLLPDSTWVNHTGNSTIRLAFHSDGQFFLTNTLNNIRGAYQVQGNQLVLSYGNTRTTYQLNFDETGNLVLSHGDLRQNVTFTRLPNIGESLAKVLETSPTAIRAKFSRIGIAVAVAVAARLFILLLQAISTLLISTERGPLGMLWRNNKAWARTIHSLILNALKYVVYCFALGFILNELGVNYTAYLASLSVIGLAIGFGSQGLVSDMVTGFFVIFENQFDVGDMVELSGMTGVIMDFGLRTTTLRSYQGQIVVIPNRNISQVGRYKLNSQLGLVDVAIPGPAAVEPGKAALRQIANQLNIEFAGVLLNEPEIDPAPIVFSTNEQFIRVRVLFWPTQTWVVEQEFVPRIKAAFKQAGIEIPADKVVTFYHPHEEDHAVDWRQQLQKRVHWRRRQPAPAASATQQGGPRST